MKRLKRISLLLAMAFVLTILAPASFAEAKTPKTTIVTETLWAGCEYFPTLQYNNMPSNAKIVSVKSSNTKVIKVEKQSSDINDTLLYPLKPGKAKITVKYKVKGKTKTVSATFKVKKYPNPLLSVKVNGKKLDIKTYKFYYDFYKYKATNTKIQVKLAKGWKIADAYRFTEKSKDGSDFNDYNVKNGKAFKVKKGYNCYVFFNLVNSKGEYLQYGIRLYRNAQPF